MANSKLLSFRADTLLQARIEAHRQRQDRKLADVLRRLVVAALALDEAATRKARKSRKVKAA